MVSGFLATIIASAIERMRLLSEAWRHSAAALYGLGVPKDSVLHYKFAIKAR